MPRFDSIVFVALFAAMAAYWHSDLFQFVGSVVVVPAHGCSGWCNRWQCGWPMPKPPRLPRPRRD
ncbi:unnamed protein product [Penicillium camemberti]|uniref:Str. FM013 n=1 Tax=Penicillium camemberti (strain FM 013) TaxID=1429867 RepID=A0A0G4PID2_PENC3|nr:unnamed protein product [Penicillium camemberti]